MVEKMLIAGVNPNTPHRLGTARHNHVNYYFHSRARPNWYRDHSIGLNPDLEDPFRLLELVYEPTRSVHDVITDCDDMNPSFFDVPTGIDDGLAGVYAAFERDEEEYEDEYEYEYLDDLTTMSFNPLLTYDPLKPQDYYPARSYWFPLHAAAKAGCNEIIELLVKHGSYLDLPSENLCRCGEDVNSDEIWTPLHTALCSGHEATANLLISLGASLTVDLRDQQPTVLHSAASCGCLSTFQYLIDTKRPLDVNGKNRFGRPPLAYARNKPRRSNELGFQISLWLVDHGADPNTILDAYDYTILHAACFEGRFRDAIRCIESGANIHAIWIDSSSRVPIDHAYSQRSYGKLKRGNGSPKISSLLDDNIEEDRVEPVEKLIKEDATIEVPDPRYPLHLGRQFQPLALASVSHLLPVMDLLVAAGANVRDDRFGIPPLLGALCPPFDYMLALRSSRADLQWNAVKWLLDHGADPNQESRYRTLSSDSMDCYGPPLMFLCNQPNFEESHRIKLVKLLLDRGANPNHRDEDGLTPLKAAINHDHYDIARCLLQKGAENLVASRDVLDMLQLIVYDDWKIEVDYELQARDKGLRRRLKFILEIDRSQTLVKDPDALNIAVRASHSQLAEILMDMGASVALRPVTLPALLSPHGLRTAAIVQRLISLGVDAELEPYLRRAIALEAWDVVNVLLLHGVQFELEVFRKYDSNDHCCDLSRDIRPLAAAMKRARSSETDDMIAGLLSGSDLSSKDPTAYEGYLQLACDKLLPRTITTLANAGVDVDSKDSEGLTPITQFLRHFNYADTSRIKPKSFVDVLKILTNGREYLDADACEELQRLRVYSGSDEMKLAIKYELSRQFIIGIDPESLEFRLQPRDVNKK